jgi:hypothetical protein
VSLPQDNGEDVNCRWAQIAIPRHQTVHGTADHHPRACRRPSTCLSRNNGIPSRASRMEKPLHRAHPSHPSSLREAGQVVTTAASHREEICTRGCRKPTPMSAVVGRARASNDPPISFLSCAFAGFRLGFSPAPLFFVSPEPVPWWVWVERRGLG